MHVGNLLQELHQAVQLHGVNPADFQVKPTLIIPAFDPFQSNSRRATPDNSSANLPC
jgi:hypothetical protein